MNEAYVRWNITISAYCWNTGTFSCSFCKNVTYTCHVYSFGYKNYLWLIFETTTNEFLSSDRHVIKDIIILPLLFFGFPYLFKIRQIKYPAYYTIWNDRFDAIFCNKQHFRNFVTCSCLPRYNFIWTNTRSRQNIFAKKNVICYW